jgi:hypothetical protein
MEVMKSQEARKGQKLFASSAPPEVLHRLRLEAYRRGMRMQDVITEILDKHLPQKIKIVVEENAS